MPPALSVSLPLAALFILAGWGAVMKKMCKFKNLPHPTWPFAENPGLALELADTNEFVDAVLGGRDTAEGAENRKSAVRFQWFDFVFIGLYVVFFSSVALAIGDGLWAYCAVGAVLLTAFLDFGEDAQILRMVRQAPSGSAKHFGQAKWIFYFLTLAVEGSLLLFGRSGATATPRSVLEFAVALLSIAIGLSGINSARKASFVGILSAANFSVLALIGLAFVPLIARSSAPLSDIAEYVVLMRVPLFVVALLLLLPIISFLTPARSLLRGLFDLTPLSLFVVTLTTLALAGTACMIMNIILGHAETRFKIPVGLQHGLSYPWWIWVSIMVLVSSPIIFLSIAFSARQNRGFRALVVAALCGTVIAAGVARALIFIEGVLGFETVSVWLENKTAKTGLFVGYAPWEDHIRAAEVLLCALMLYIVVGIYGRWRLGESRTVPALCSALMLITMITWILGAVTFFFDFWHIPTLVIIAIAGTITAQSRQSDHFYTLSRRDRRIFAPDPGAVICATGAKRVLLVAANGGGIQAGAWAAQVLYGLHQDCEPHFVPALRMISSVSGGSVGTACFVAWLRDSGRTKEPDAAAAESSLDEVAWGLAWPDFIRALCPWIFPNLIGRGRALEEAWCMNSSRKLGESSRLNEPLSGWNDGVQRGELPAVIMNGTISETGSRLLMATTRMMRSGPARVDATELHTLNDTQFDISAVTAARLSATFPYVTPASRSNGPGPQPHIVDGGYYDNYGMATMVEWLDEALSKAVGQVESVLVLQIHGAPTGSDKANTSETKNRGWFYQVIAPLLTLAAVRSSGQIAHNDIELCLLQQKWQANKVPIHSVVFEFSNPQAPLSWHLTPREVGAIRSAWTTDMGACRTQVKRFLEGSDDLMCGCWHCNARPVGM